MLTTSLQAREGVLVWVDAREAVIVRWAAGVPSVDRHLSDVPVHRRSTGHVRHDPTMRHGGGGAPQDAGEHQRLEHLDRFLDEVADLLEADEDVVLVGPGTVHERLETRLRALDGARHRVRPIGVGRAGPLTERQLVARLRAHLGISPRRGPIPG